MGSPVARYDRSRDRIIRAIVVTRIGKRLLAPHQVQGFAIQIPGSMVGGKRRDTAKFLFLFFYVYRIRRRSGYRKVVQVNQTETFFLGRGVTLNYDTHLIHNVSLYIRDCKFHADPLFLNQLDIALKEILFPVNGMYVWRNTQRLPALPLIQIKLHRYGLPRICSR